jgi:hypothetical protein
MMRAADKRLLAAVGVQAGALAAVLLVGGFTRLGAVPAPAPVPGPTVTVQVQVPVPVISTKYIQVSPTHRSKSNRARPPGPAVPNPAPDGPSTVAPVGGVSSTAANGGQG